MLGIMLSKKDKDAIRKIAQRNNLSMSDAARMLIKSGLSSFKEPSLK